MRVLVDGDLLVYRAGFAAEKTWYKVEDYDSAWDENTVLWCESKKDCDALCAKLAAEQRKFTVETERRLEPEYAALHNVRSLVERALEAVQATEDDVTVYLSGESNFRNNIATIRGYKANRDKNHKPTHGPAIKEYMAKHWDTHVAIDEEADDMIGYTQYGIWQEDPHGSVIVSADKDMNMIPGLHYNFLREESYYVDEEAADRFFWTQMLTGDPTDNIPGVPKIGKIKAEKALAGVPPDQMYAKVRTLYVQGYGEEKADEALLENGRLLWIRRKENEVWQPK